MIRLLSIALTIGLFAPCASAQSSGQTDGSVRGIVFAAGPRAAHSVVPATKVTLDGPIHLEAESDGEGRGTRVVLELPRVSL